MVAGEKDFRRFVSEECAGSTSILGHISRDHCNVKSTRYGAFNKIFLVILCLDNLFPSF
jgi:hypothetical protein